MRVSIWSVLVLGVWLILFEFAFAHLGQESNTALANDVVVAVVLIAASLHMAAIAPRPARVATWVLIAASIWLPVAPFVLGYAHDNAAQNQMLNEFFVAGLVFIIAVVRLMEIRRRVDFQS